MKYLMIVGLFLINFISFAEIKIKIHEPMRFDNINISTFKNAVIGKATLEISTDDLENDFGKKLVFKFPDEGLMTNKKRWLKIDKYIMDKNEKNIIIENKRRLVNIYAFIDRTSLNNNKFDAKVLEGEYVGYLPIIISQYSKIIDKKTNTKGSIK